MEQFTLTSTANSIRVLPQPGNHMPEALLTRLQPDTDYEVVWWSAHSAYLALRERDNWDGPQYQHIGSIRTAKPYGAIT